MNRVFVALLLVSAAACSKKAGSDKGAGFSGSGSAASSGGTGSSAPVDTAKWSDRDLSSLGVEDFSFPGTIKLPPGAETQTTALYGGDGTEKIGVVAYVDLPSGTRVNIAERDKHAVNDPEVVRTYLQTHGKLVFERAQPTWYMVAVDTGHGLEIQGQFWAVPPGISCSTQRPVSLADADLVTAMCSSFAAKK